MARENKHKLSLFSFCTNKYTHFLCYRCLYICEWPIVGRRYGSHKWEKLISCDLKNKTLLQDSKDLARLLIIRFYVNTSSVYLMKLNYSN